MAKYRIGITERGDAATDLSWVRRLPDVDGCVVVTKNITSKAVRDALLANASKCVLHATITGWGSSVLEPNVPRWQDCLKAASELVEAGFPKSHVVIRVDPIMPWNPEPSRAVILSAYQPGFKRVRVSVLDTYRHMTERFHAAGVGTPEDLGITKAEGIARVAAMLNEVAADCPGIRIEACAEPGLNVIHQGCISPTDLELMGLSDPDADQTGYQRPACMCYSGKTELLTRKARCPHQCLYCYWRDVPVSVPNTFA